VLTASHVERVFKQVCVCVFKRFYNLANDGAERTSASSSFNSRSTYDAVNTVTCFWSFAYGRINLSFIIITIIITSVSETIRKPPLFFSCYMFQASTGGRSCVLCDTLVCPIGRGSTGSTESKIDHTFSSWGQTMLFSCINQFLLRLVSTGR